MSISIPGAPINIGKPFGLKVNLFEVIKSLIQKNFPNFDSFSEPVVDYTKKLSSSITLATSLSTDTLYISNVQKFLKQDINDIKYIQAIQQRKMKELWDNVDDEEWEYV